MSTVVHIASLSARLDAEWDRLATSTTADEALSRWRRHTTRLAGFTNFEAIRQAVHDRGQPQRADQILAALVRLASVSGHDDRLAAWLVLQLLKPGAVRLAHQLAALAGDMDTSQALVFGELTLGIRQYPWQRRPRQIAANLLLDCRQRITRSRQRHHAELPCGLSPDSHHRETDHDLLDNRLAVRHLLWKARQCTVLSAFEVRLLSGVYLDDLPVDQLATILGRSRSTLYAIRSGAERRLRDAFAADQPPVRSTDPDPDQVAARHQAGRSVAWLARRYGISPQKVLTTLDHALANWNQLEHHIGGIKS